MASFHLQSIYYVVKYYTQFLSFPKGIFNLAFLILNSISMDLFFILMLIINCTSSTILFAFTCIIFIKMRQLNVFLKKAEFKPRDFYRFMKAHTKTVTDVMDGNKFYGYLLVYYIIFIVPMNNFVVIGLFEGEFNLLTGYFHFCVSCFAYLGIVVFHLVAAMYSKHIHKCVRPLLRLHHLFREKKFQFKHKLRLVLYIEKFNVVKRYGIKYGSYGLMSTASIFKVHFLLNKSSSFVQICPLQFALIYSELIMYSYRIYQNKKLLPVVSSN